VRRVGQRSDDVSRVDSPVGVEPDCVDSGRRVVLVRQRPGDSQNSRGVRGRRIGAQREHETAVRALDLVAPERLGERPVSVAVRAAARSDHDRGRWLERPESRDGVLAVAVRPEHEGVGDGVAPAMPPHPGRAPDVHVGATPERDRAGRQSA
jgi:hypothetical protein